MLCNEHSFIVYALLEEFRELCKIEFMVRLQGCRNRYIAMQIIKWHSYQKGSTKYNSLDIKVCH